MADFHQNGIVTTLHNLNDRPLEEMEDELASFSKTQPMALILPSLYSELEGDALANIVQQLAKVKYLSHIVIGLDRANEDQYRHALEFFKPLDQRYSVLWNDGPALRSIDKRLLKEGLAPLEPGKGRNVWYCMGYVQGLHEIEAVALHDCDIVTYDKSLLARLIYPIANPNFNYQFCKGYYARVANGKIHGRVTRLLVSPLIKALAKTLGHSEFLDYMDSFRYPLAGEFSFRREVINDIRIPNDWGLEIGVLSELERSHGYQRICQADIADVYDHKHQDLSAEDAEKGLSKMSTDIAKAFFRKLATKGHVFDSGTFRTIKASYYRIALEFVEAHYNVARMNGLSFDIHKEEKAVELFAKNILVAGQAFMEYPMQRPFMASWNRVTSAFPDIIDELQQAVASDMETFG